MIAALLVCASCACFGGNEHLGMMVSAIVAYSDEHPAADFGVLAGPGEFA